MQIVFNGEKCQSILQILYQNRKRQSTKSILIINKIMQVVSFFPDFYDYMLKIAPGDYIDKSVIYFFKKVVDQFEEAKQNMIYNMEGFSRIDYNSLIYDTRKLINDVLAKETQQPIYDFDAIETDSLDEAKDKSPEIPKRNIYGDFKT